MTSLVIPESKNSQVKQLPQQEITGILYLQPVMQVIVDRHRIMLKAIQEDLKLLYDNNVVLLSDEDKVLLDKLLVPGTIDSTVPQQLEDIADLQLRVSTFESQLILLNAAIVNVSARVTTLEGFHP